MRYFRWEGSLHEEGIIGGRTEARGHFRTQGFMLYGR